MPEMCAVGVVSRSCSVVECTYWCTYGDFEWEGKWEAREEDEHRMKLEDVMKRAVSMRQVSFLAA